MNSQRQQDFQRRLQELEAEVQQSETARQSGMGASPSPQPQSALLPILQRVWLQVIAWFSPLPTAGKVVAVVVAAILGLSLLNAVLNLVTTLVMLAIGVAVLYVLYRAFTAAERRQQN